MKLRCFLSMDFLSIMVLLLTLAAPVLRAQETPLPVLKMDFAADDPARVLPAEAHPVLTTDPAEEVGGRKSLKGDSRGSGTEWNEFFRTKTGLFAPGEAYRVSFDYKVIARNADAKFYALARHGQSDTAGWVEWSGEAGATGHIETKFATRGAADDTLILGIQNGGALAINNLQIAVSPQSRPPDLPAPKRTWKSPGHTTYYLDSAGGRDTNDGQSPKQAWRGLDRVNAGEFAPGDRILLKAGSRWNGFLAPGGSGAAGKPVVVGAYGTGPKPALDAAGKWLATVYLHNGEWWDIGGLDIANIAPERQPNLAGVQVSLNDFGTAHGIRLHDLTIHDVRGSNVKEDGGGNGINCASGGGKVKTRYDGLVIENCRLTRTDRNGITLSAYYPRPEWPLSTGVVIRGNVLEDIGGDGIVPIGCDGALIERNRLHGGRMRAEDYAAGIWPWSCDNTVVQYNEVSGMKGTKDGEGYDSDYNCRNTLFQYNFSHDNDGGFMLICNDGGQSSPWNIGNTGTVIRYNVSVRDGEHTFNITGPCKNTQIYNNVFYLAKGQNVPLVSTGNWGGGSANWPLDTRFVNNVFYVDGQSRFEFGGMTDAAFENNAFWGRIESRPTDPRAVLTDPKLSAPGSLLPDGYRPLPISPLLRAGKPVKDNGGRGFWGKAISAKGPTFIGAGQAK